MKKSLIVLFLVCSYWTIVQSQSLAGKPKPSTTGATTPSDSIPTPEMVLVEGGTYMMGLSTNAPGSMTGNTPRTHQVTVSSFRISKYEITQREWRWIMGDSANYSLNKGCGQCPVEEVSWNDVQLFIQRLNAKTGKQYRLPTEAQWEFAARGGNKSKKYKYAGSDHVEDVAELGGTFTGQTHPAGSKRANEIGLYDMTGNVAEWCSDLFDPWYRPGAVTDPAGATSGTGHLIRGGSWGVHPTESEVTSFQMGYPNDRNARVGFRLVLLGSTP